MKLLVVVVLAVLVSCNAELAMPEEARAQLEMAKQTIQNLVAKLNVEQPIQKFKESPLASKLGEIFTEGSVALEKFLVFMTQRVAPLYEELLVTVKKEIQAGMDATEEDRGHIVESVNNLREKLLASLEQLKTDIAPYVHNTEDRLNLIRSLNLEEVWAELERTPLGMHGEDIMEMVKNMRA